MRINYKYDDRGFAKKIRKAPGKADKEIKNAIAIATRNTSKGAKSFAPVDHSGLKSGIRPNINGFTGEVISEKHYSPYQEFGTGTKVNVPSELRDYAIQFKGKGIRKVNMRAQPFLYPAFFINREKFNHDVDRRMNNII